MNTILLQVIKKQKILTASLLFTIVGAITFAILPPLLLEKIVNQLTTNQPIALKMALSYFALLALSGLLDATKETLITLFGQRITHTIRSCMCQKLSLLPASYYTTHSAGSVTSCFVNDVNTVESLFTNGIISMLVDICKVLSILCIIFYKSPGLGILLCITLPFLFHMTRRFQQNMLQAQLQNRTAIAKVNNHIPETLSNIQMIRNFSKQKYMENAYDSYIQDSYQAMEKSNFYDAVYSPIILVISAIVVGIMMVLASSGGTMQSLFGMSVGTAVAIIAYVGKVFDPIESIGMEIQNIQSAFAGMQRVNAFLSEAEEKPGAITQIDNMMTNDKVNAVTFQHVSFSYDAEQTILHDISFTIKRGENVTIMGRTGAGKSTICKLILGLYQPYEGNVNVFGMNANNISNTCKRNLFGYVNQSFEQVPGSVKEQITLFDESITLAQVEKAIAMVGLSETIQALPQGYDTPCHKQLFSQGQFQLLSIARAIVKEPPILLLDEITANLDSETEDHVMKAIEQAGKNRTTISISHRVYERLHNSRIIQLT